MRPIVVYFQVCWARRWRYCSSDKITKVDLPTWGKCIF